MSRTMELQLPTASYDGYIFDLDGTLIDTMPLHYVAWAETLKQAGLQPVLDEDLFYSLGGVPTRNVAEHFARHYGLSLDPDAVVHAKEAAFVQHLAKVALIEPVVAFARKAAETRPVSIASGGVASVVAESLRVTGLDSLFKIVITPSDVAPGRGKPAPDMFLEAARRMGVNPKRCLVFEDAQPGIEAAKAAGMDHVHVPSRKLGA